MVAGVWCTSWPRALFDEIVRLASLRPAIVACAREAGGDAAVLVMTHDHGLDYRRAAAALASSAAFVGLIGSATKRARFTRRLS